MFVARPAHYLARVLILEMQFPETNFAVKCGRIRIGAKHGSEGVGFQVDVADSGEPAADRSVDAVNRVGNVACQKVAMETNVERQQNGIRSEIHGQRMPSRLDCGIAFRQL
jgi:hypothetical protein